MGGQGKHMIKSFNGYNMITKSEWQRYTNSQLFLGDKEVETLRVSGSHTKRCIYE